MKDIILGLITGIGVQKIVEASKEPQTVVKEVIKEVPLELEIEQRVVRKHFNRIFLIPDADVLWLVAAINEGVPDAAVHQVKFDDMVDEIYRLTKKMYIIPGSGNFYTREYVKSQWLNNINGGQSEYSFRLIPHPLPGDDEAEGSFMQSAYLMELFNLGVRSKYFSNMRCEIASAQTPEESSQQQD